MKVVFNPWQRIILLNMVSAREGNVGVMRNCMKLLDVLELSLEETQEIGLTVDQQTGNITIAKPMTEFTLELPDGEPLELLRELVKSNQQWPARNAREVVGLFEQLQIDE